MSVTKSRRSNAALVASAVSRRSATQLTVSTEIAALKQRVEALVEHEEIFEAALNEWIYETQQMRSTTEAILANAAVLLRAARPYAQRKQTG